LTNIISRANARLETAQRSGDAKIASLEAQLRRTELRSSTAQTKLDQLNKQNEELMAISDELIARGKK